MITLPPGLDVGLFVNDYFALATPFVSIAVLFCSYRFIMKCIGGGR
jgi:hypothetical protein